MDQQLQVVEGKFLHILSKLLLLIHALNEEQGLRAHLRAEGAGWGGAGERAMDGHCRQKASLRPRTAARTPGSAAALVPISLLPALLLSFLKSDSPCQGALALDLGSTGSPVPGDMSLAKLRFTQTPSAGSHRSRVCTTRQGRKCCATGTLPGREPPRGGR